MCLPCAALQDALAHRCSIVMEYEAHEVKCATFGLACLPVNIFESEYLPVALQMLMQLCRQISFHPFSKPMQLLLVSSEYHNIIRISNVVVYAEFFLHIFHHNMVESLEVQLREPLRSYESKWQPRKSLDILPVFNVVRSFFWLQHSFCFQYLVAQAQESVVFDDMRQLRFNYLDILCVEAMSDIHLQNVEFLSFVAFYPLFNRFLSAVRSFVRNASQRILI